MKTKIYFLFLIIPIIFNLNAWRYPDGIENAENFASYTLKLSTNEKLKQKDMSWHTAVGEVDFTGGLTIENAATTMDVTVPIKKEIYFKNNSLFQAHNNVELSHDCSIRIDDKGFIDLNGNTIILSNNLSIPKNKALEFLSDAQIDGKGNELILQNNAQLIVDSNKTLTLKNLTLKTSSNYTESFPPIKTLLDSKLCLQDVRIILGDKFEFQNGQLYINNDVAITGTNEFIYSSTQSLYINKKSQLLIDLDTIFTYSPYNNDRDLIKMDASSTLYLNGCTLQSTFTGIRLTKGNLVVDNHVTFSTLYLNSKPQINQFESSTQTFSDKRLPHRQGFNGQVKMVYSPRGRDLAIVNTISDDTVDSYGIQADGSLTTLQSNWIWRAAIKDMDVDDVRGYGVNISPDIGGWQTYLHTGGAYSQDTWHWGDPEGTLLGDKIIFTHNLLLLLIKGTGWLRFPLNIPPPFGGGTSGATFPGGSGNCVSASRNNEFQKGDFIAVGTTRPAIYIYSDIEEAPPTYRSTIFPGGNFNKAIAEFSPANPRILAGALYDNIAFQVNVVIYYMDEVGMTTTLSIDNTSSSLTSLESIAVSPFGDYIAVGGDKGTSDKVEIYKINDDYSLSLVETLEYDSSAAVGNLYFTTDNKYLLLSSNAAASNPIEVHPFKYPYNFTHLNYYNSYNWTSDPYKTPSLTDNAITFGHSELGSNYNLKIDILAGAKIKLLGLLNIDNTP